MWDISISIGLGLLALSFVLPEPAAATVTRILAVVAFALAAVFSVPGIA